MVSADQTTPADPGIDVTGVMFRVPGGHPSVLVQLNLQVQQLDPDGDGGIRTGVDHMPQSLAASGLVPWSDLTRPPPLAAGQRPCTVRHRPDRPDTSGVFAASAHSPRGWTLMAPAPPWPAMFDELVPMYNFVMSVYVTTHTVGLQFAPGRQLIEALNAEAAAGRLYCCRGVVV